MGPLADRPGLREDPRPLLYGIFDLLMAAALGYLFTVVVPSRHLDSAAMLWVLVTLIAVVGGSTLTRSPAGWVVAAVGCVVQLVLVAIVFTLIVASAAYLSGVYGAFGRAGALVSLGVAIMTLTVLGMLPALQLKFLMTRAGRRCFGRHVASP